MKLPHTLSERLSSFCQEICASAEKTAYAQDTACRIYQDILSYRQKTGWNTNWQYPVEQIAFELMTALVFAGESHTTLLEIADLASTLDTDAVCRVAGIPKPVLDCILTYQERLVEVVLAKHQHNGVLSEDELNALLHAAPYPHY